MLTELPIQRQKGLGRRGRDGDLQLGMPVAHRYEDTYAKGKTRLVSILSCPFQIKTSLLYSEDNKKLSNNFT